MRIRHRRAAEQPSISSCSLGRVPLCWMHHRLYDTGGLELLPFLESAWREEVAHAVKHLGLIGAVRRLAPGRTLSRRTEDSPDRAGLSFVNQRSRPGERSSRRVAPRAVACMERSSRTGWPRCLRSYRPRRTKISRPLRPIGACHRHDSGLAPEIRGTAKALDRGDNRHVNAAVHRVGCHPEPAAGLGSDGSYVGSRCLRRFVALHPHPDDASTIRHSPRHQARAMRFDVDRPHFLS